MPFDAIAWSEGAPGTGTVGLLAGLNDQIYQTSGDDIIAKKRAPFLMGLLYLAETTPGHAQIRTPDLKQYYQFMKSGDLNDLVSAGAFTDLRGRPLPIKPNDKMTAYSVNATDEDTIVGALMSSGRITTAMTESVNPTHIIRGSWDLTLIVNSWTSAAPVWDQVLAAGRYAIIGMKVGTYLGTPGGGMARLILPESKWRPGVPLVGLVGDKITMDMQSHAPWQYWPKMQEIELEHDNMPQVELISPIANTDHAIELLLEKIS